ncbi:hypothetical protein [Mesorhizobium shangrilense]|uniref:Uncharacterized protein n=1 Tax=Mesorhizobium shangrilense TaxID=460060 RepID=A0ABV2DNS2_9HYPH
MHAVVRTFSGTGAKELFDLLEAKKGDVEAVLRKVKGFTGYTLIRTGNGGLSVTVCKDKAGTDESVVVARDWVKKNASGTGVAPPTLAEGSVILHLK